MAKLDLPISLLIIMMDTSAVSGRMDSSSWTISMRPSLLTGR